MKQFDLQMIVIRIPAILMALSFHEFGHAWAATRFGDDTPRHQGRVTLSPLAHIDIVGLMLFLLVGIGWAKPVLVDTSRLRPRVLGDIVVSLAGVGMNFMLAFFAYFIFLLSANGLLFGYRNAVLDMVLLQIVLLNAGLIGFNLIPLPPLDGFRVARYLFPPNMSHVVTLLYRIGPFILMASLIFFQEEISTLFIGPIAMSILSVVQAVLTPIVRFGAHLLG